MNTSSLSLFIVAVPPIVGSFIVLALADVGWSVWISHLMAILAACCLGLMGCHMNKRGNHLNVACVVVILTLIGLAIPLLGDSTEPERWIPVGPLRFYVAPLLLPSFIAACSVFMAKDGKYQMMYLAAALVAALLLALQPDASQVLGLLVASSVVIVHYRLGTFYFSAIVIPLALVTMWAFSLPDPFAPVPHVEEVFALALGHSLLAGIAVIASAFALIFGLWRQSINISPGLSAVAAYYMVLFVCSTAGITPAPLVGYGAGPILGFGLMVGLLGWFKNLNRPNKSMQPTVNASVD